MFRHTELKIQTYWFKHTESVDSVCLIILIKTKNILIRTYWINRFNMLESYWLKLKAILIITYWINQFSILKPYWLQFKTYWLKYLNAKTYWSYINNIHAARSLLLRSSFDSPAITWNFFLWLFLRTRLIARITCLNRVTEHSAQVVRNYQWTKLRESG